MKSKNKEILAELRDNFLDGAKLSVDEIIKEYFKPKTAYSYLLAKATVKGWMRMIQRQFKYKHGLWFGSLDSLHRYGIISTEEEVRFSMMRAYKFVKGAVENTGLLLDNADSLNLLPEGVTRERLLVAKMIEDDSSDK